MNRRSFIASMLAAGATPLMPGCFSAKGYKANGKVRLAAIGVGQQAWYDLQQFKKDASDICEVVALCDNASRSGGRYRGDSESRTCRDLLPER